MNAPTPSAVTSILSSRSRLFALMAAASLVPCTLSRILADPSDPEAMRVFGSYRASGLAALQGLDPYGLHPGTWVFDLGGLRFADLNLNPPTLLPLFEAFALLDAGLGSAVWAVASALLALATAGIVLLRNGPRPQARQVLWLFAMPALADTILLGQIYVLLFALSARAWIGLKRGRPLAAGAAIGLIVLMKPTFVLWPVALLVAGHRRPAVAALLVAASLGGLSLALHGADTYRAWLAALAADRHVLIATECSLTGYVSRLGLPALGQATALLLVLAGLTFLHRHRPGAGETTGIAVAVTLLASPLAWMHYALVLAPALLDRPWCRTMTAGAALLMVPVHIPRLATNGSFWEVAALGGLYTAGFGLILSALVLRARRAEAPAPAGGVPATQLAAG